MHKSTHRFLLSIFFVAFAGIAAHFLLSERALENIGGSIMYPILLAQAKIVAPIKHYFEHKKNYGQLLQEYYRLQCERESLLAENIELHGLLSYVSETKELVAFKEKYHDPDALLSQVLVKHFSDQMHYYLIDKGSVDGITHDMVAVFKNCVLGRVIEVYPYYSKVVLITDKACKVAAYCAHTKASGIHEGDNNTGGTLNYVSHLVEMESEDLLITSGDGLVFPKGFALGTIKSCEVKGLFHQVSVEPLLNLRKIDYCFIISKGGKEACMQPEIVAMAEHINTVTAKELHDLDFHNEVIKYHEAKQLLEQQRAMINADRSRTVTGA